MLPMENGSSYCFPTKKEFAGGTEKVEHLEDKITTVAMFLHSFQASAAYEGSLEKGWKELPRHDA